MESRRGGERGDWIFTGLLGLVSLILVGMHTIWDAPARYDGAGYAVLGRALSEGDGYRAIDHPDAPRHGHFPPGYPLVVAGLAWCAGGVRWDWLHGVSAGATALAVMGMHRWLRGMWGAREAFWASLAVAINWRWTREGGVIRSEPMFLLWMSLALVCAQRIDRAQRLPWSAGLGVLLGVLCLTRQVGMVVAVAIGVDLWRRGQRAACGLAAGCGMLLVLPWLVWQALVGRGEAQAQFLVRGRVWETIPSQVLFYVQRIPDQVVGPVVEWATVYSGSRLWWWMATGLAALGVGVMAWGWWRLARGRETWLLGWVPVFILGLLVCWPFTEAGRFLIPLVPWLVSGLVEGTRSLLRLLGWPVDRAGVAVGVCVASLPFTLYGIVTDRAGAVERTHEGFDAACRWIGEASAQPGPILTRQAGEAYWLSGRKALSPAADVGGVEEQIERYGVAYLILDEARYTDAPESPLGAFVRETRRALRPVGPRGGPVVVLEVVEESEGSGGSGQAASRIDR